ncbi:MAG: bifunctional riboflavin kinase/FAD synthetase, partial [Dokdonella sp.]
MNCLVRDVAGPKLCPAGSVVAIGAFDGVHRGHQAVLARVCERAQASGLTPVVISFEPLPREYFGHAKDLPRLTNVREKLERFAKQGIEKVLLLRFNAALATMSAEDFVARVLVERCAAREVLVGEDFRFGARRAGDLALLERMGEQYGFVARTIPVFSAANADGNGQRISSSSIRSALANSEFARAAEQLGRMFSMGGHVVHGAKLGRKLGFPTANIPLRRRVPPVAGIFAVRVLGAAVQVLPGVASLGTRPTVAGTERLLEAHLFDFDGDLYGQRIEVEFVAKLRDEEKFADLDALVWQMQRDAEQARAIL